MQLEILKFIQSFRTPFLDKLFESITITAEESAFIIIAALFIWCLNKELGYRLGFICLSGSAFNVGLKETFHTARPIGQEGIISIRVETAPGYSFPSGHTQTSAAFWSTLMFNLKSKPLYILGTTIMLLVALSRMYLGVHWPIDVLGGIVLGIGWVILVSKLYDYSKKMNNKLIFLLLLIPMFAGLIFFHEDGYIKACGSMLGFYLGYFLEDTYIKYDTKANIFIQIIKLALGLAILIGLKSGLKLLFPASLISDFIRYAVIGIWVPAGAPFLFNKLFGKHPAAPQKSQSFNA